jgi:5'-phosphate synthase pdxT subunit
VRVNRNHFGRQIESFEADLDLSFLRSAGGSLSTGQQDGMKSGIERMEEPFKAIFIRAPIVERLLSPAAGIQTAEASLDDIVVAPSRDLSPNTNPGLKNAAVEILATLPGRGAALKESLPALHDSGRLEEAGDIVAVRQGNVLGTSFHPELTGDPRIHVWWLEQVVKAVDEARGATSS